ncbi:MAG: class I SAM-dependent methyltransferase [Candidatus Heimdallarchaeota archaeon]
MSGHYYSKKPSTSRKTTTIRTFQLGNSLAFKSQSGIFGWQKVDTGSELLIDTAEIPASGSILDLGCGYGLIGIVLAKANPNLQITLTDINTLAIKWTRINCKLNEVVENTDVRQGDLFEAVKEQTFDLIICNPPLMAGKAVLKRLIADAKNHITKNGSLQIVVPKKKGLLSMQKLLVKVFESYEVLAKGSGFWIMKAQL